MLQFFINMTVHSITKLYAQTDIQRQIDKLTDLQVDRLIDINRRKGEDTNTNGQTQIDRLIDRDEIDRHTYRQIDARDRVGETELETQTDRRTGTDTHSQKQAKIERNKAVNKIYKRSIQWNTYNFYNLATGYS